MTPTALAPGPAVPGVAAADWPLAGAAADEVPFSAPAPATAAAGRAVPDAVASGWADGSATGSGRVRAAAGRVSAGRVSAGRVSAGRVAASPGTTGGDTLSGPDMAADALLAPAPGSPARGTGVGRAAPIGAARGRTPDNGGPRPDRGLRPGKGTCATRSATRVTGPFPPGLAPPQLRLHPTGCSAPRWRPDLGPPRGRGDTLRAGASLLPRLLCPQRKPSPSARRRFRLGREQRPRLGDERGRPYRRPLPGQNRSGRHRRTPCCGIVRGEPLRSRHSTVARDGSVLVRLRAQPKSWSW